MHFQHHIIDETMKASVKKKKKKYIIMISGKIHLFKVQVQFKVNAVNITVFHFKLECRRPLQSCSFLDTCRLIFVF